MKKRNCVVFLLIICILCNVLGVSYTQAWFVSGGSSGKGEYLSAKVNYLPTTEPDNAQKLVYGALIDEQIDDIKVYIVPGDEIIKAFSPTEKGILSIENFSSVDTNVRANVVCTLSETDGTPIGIDLQWKSIGNSTYQLGTKVMVDGKEIHMGLLNVQFASKKVNETTAPGFTPNEADGTPYAWEFIHDDSNVDISFANAWELRLNGNNTVPTVLTDERQLYNVITSVGVVGVNEDNQVAFNAYFSNNYAGKIINISIDYYAKQLMGMEWSMFTSADFAIQTPST